MMKRPYTVQIRSGWWTKLIVMMALLAFCHLTVLPNESAYAQEESSPSSDAGLGVASALITIPYGVSKIVYAALGGIVGGLTWVVTGGNTEAAQSVWEPSFYGTYVITPDHLRGNEPVRFFGASPYEDDEFMSLPVPFAALQENA